MKRYTVATRIQFEDGWTERVFGFVDEGISPSPRMDASDVSVVLINPSEVTCRGATHNYLTVSDDG